VKHIVFTRHDGGVSVTTPNPNIILHMMFGTGWSEFPHYDEDEQIERQIAGGIRETHAVAYARAIMRGGLSEREALAIMCDRDCARFGTLHELQDTEDLPSDRWFRDAWARSHNGGPIGVAMPKARVVQLDKIKDALAIRNRKRIELGRDPFKLSWWSLGSAIRHARDAEELRQVWPATLVRPLDASPPGEKRQPDHGHQVLVFEDGRAVKSQVVKGCERDAFRKLTVELGRFDAYQVDEAAFPRDDEFRHAWTFSGGTFGHDMARAREIHRNRLRPYSTPLTRNSCGRLRAESAPPKSSPQRTACAMRRPTRESMRPRPWPNCGPSRCERQRLPPRPRRAAIDRGRELSRNPGASA
jgi:hypothetical protein